MAGFEDGAKARPSNCCRHCGTPLRLIFADLNATPVSNDFIPPERRLGPESHYPLRAFVCTECRLVQLEDFRKAEDLFREDYAYFSSVSTSWVEHAKTYAEQVTGRFGLGSDSRVVEVASNDGYLLQFFKRRGMEVLGIEPSKSVADFAMSEKGIDTIVDFFGEDLGRTLAASGKTADLTAANNVLAHVPDINDFVSGFREILAPDGVATFEFPSLLNLIRHNQFDTIYHEHFSYLSLLAVSRIFATNGLRIFDVEHIATHGGSLRVFACRETAPHEASPAVDAQLNLETEAGLDEDAVYTRFSAQVRETKYRLLQLLIDLKLQGKSIVGYGAPAKGNTLLNYCGIGREFLDLTVDKSPAKQGLFLPGTRLPIFHPDKIREVRPDYVLVLPWNIKEEVMDQLSFIDGWGGKFILPIPEARIV